VEIYPNPNTGLFQIFIAHKMAGDVVIEAYNILGMKIYDQTFYAVAGDNTVEIVLPEFSNGEYFIRIKTSELTTTKKVVVN